MQCGVPEGCIDLTGIDFGLCDMDLGIGWSNNQCEYISGCDWVANGVNYAEAFFTSMDSCHQTCMVLFNDNDLFFARSYSLYQNYPNPFNPVTNFAFDLPEQGYVTLVVYDIMGREIAKIFDGDLSSGHYKINWHGKHGSGTMPESGVYFYQLTANDFQQTKKMLIIK